MMSFYVALEVSLYICIGLVSVSLCFNSGSSFEYTYDILLLDNVKDRKKTNTNTEINC